MPRSDEVESNTAGRALRGTGQGCGDWGEDMGSTQHWRSFWFASQSHFLCRFGLLEIMTPHQSLLVPTSNGISA